MRKKGEQNNYIHKVQPRFELSSISKSHALPLSATDGTSAFRSHSAAQQEQSSSKSNNDGATINNNIQSAALVSATSNSVTCRNGRMP
jgi:hypothetical protein